jgi:glycosyltransferase involved in cell wall biosynthesis
MKIAMFAPLLGVEATGQSLVVANTANQLAAAGHTVTVLATDCGYRGREVSQFVAFSPQVAVHIFPVTGALSRRLYHSTALIEWVYEHIAEFDVLDMHGIWSWSVGALADAFHIHRKPYVLTPHGAMTRYDWRKGRWKRALFYRLKLSDVWNLADAVRFLSKGEEEQSYYPAHGRSAVVPNGVDLEPMPTVQQRTAARQQLGIAADSQVLLFLGRITHQKGVKEIVAAFEVAAQQLPNLRLYLVGPAEGRYGEEVLAQIQQSPVHDRIVAPGAVFGDARNAYFRAADVFITLSHNEGLSLAHLEALAHGLPMVLTASSNLDQLETYGAGIFTTHDPKQVAQDIVKLMADPATLAVASVQAQRLIAENFSWQHVVPQLVALYQQVIDDRS